MNPSYRTESAWTWANFLLGHRMIVKRNAGIGGDTSTMARARFAADVLAHDAAWLIGMVGTNDAGVTSAEAFAVPLETTKATSTG